MFCNKCGKKYTRESDVCPYCGNKQGSLSQGNGFFDMFDKKVDSNVENQLNYNQSETDIAYLKMSMERQSRQIMRMKKRHTVLTIVLLFVFLLSVIFSVGNMLYTNSVSKRLSDMTANENAEIPVQTEQVQQTEEPEAEKGEGFINKPEETEKPEQTYPPKNGVNGKENKSTPEPTATTYANK